MAEKPNPASQDETAEPDRKTMDKIGELIADLNKGDGLLREKARNELETIGLPGVPALIEASGHRNKNVRWEAVKALGHIGDVSAAEALVTSLEDEIYDIRWLAAEGLIRLGPAALEPLLKALTVRSESLWLRQGAHHVTSHMAKKDTMAEHHESGHPHRVTPELAELVQPLFAALNDVAASMAVPAVARMVLE